jgi:hypothetical protein
MDRFRGQIDNCHGIGKPGLVLMLRHVEGMPEPGMTISIAGQTARIIAVGKNATDGKPVSNRSCLTGKPTAPYGSIFVEWTGEWPSRLEWVQEEAVH